jgi:hypothetical protein
MNSGHGLETLRAFLEVLYFVAGIVIAGAAIRGLHQINLTKKIAIKNAKREDLKFAAERCQYYAENVFAASAALTEARKTLGLPPLVTSARLNASTEFDIKDGEINLELEPKTLLEIADTTIKTAGPLATYLNSLEAFAIPFVAGVADDDLGFQETAISFCRSIPAVIPLIAAMRTVGGAHYESCVKLYDCWSKRLKAEDLRKQMKDLEGKIKATPVHKIKPVGGV